LAGRRKTNLALVELVHVRHVVRLNHTVNLIRQYHRIFACFNEMLTEGFMSDDES